LLLRPGGPAVIVLEPIPDGKLRRLYR
jgi:hypothetical protein